jgi:nucleotide-binding universal stress UspA family protein
LQGISSPEILLVHEEAPMDKTADRIVVGVDGSTGSHEALRWAIEDAKRRASDLEILICWHPPFLAEASGYGVAFLSPDELTAEARAQLENALGPVRADLEAIGALGHTVTTRLVEGAPGPNLVTESKGAALVIVGRRGHSGLARLVMGSVSRYVVTHAACPVVVVPDEDDTA